MKYLLYSVVALSLAGMPAFSQSAIIRSGEHANFTRLVVPLPKGTVWEILESKRFFSLKYEVPEVAFDLSQVFARIPRKRLTAVFQDGPGSDLEFQLACDCSVSSFVDTPGFVVIDIGDEEVSTEQRKQALRIPKNQNPYRFPVLESQVKTAIPRGIRLPAATGVESQRKLEVGRNPTSIQQPTVPKATISLSEERLLAQIIRASNQGLLELAEGPPPMGLGGAQNVEPGSIKLDESVPTSLTATTAIDLYIADSAAKFEPLVSEIVCINSSLISINKWGMGKSYSTAVGQLRSQLYGEFDELKASAALDLARLNLHYGFGLEALQAVDLSGEKSTASDILRELASLLDSRNQMDNTLLSGQQTCEGDVALWSLLIAEEFPEDVNDSAVSRAFIRLPPQLRSIIGPQISQKYTDAGRNGMANRILETINNSSDNVSSGVGLARASAAEQKGNAKSEEAELIWSIEDGSEFSPKALIQFIANKYENREPVPPGLSDLVAAYATEFGQAEIGPELRQALVVALALAGEYGKAFSVIEEIEMQGKGSNHLAPTSQFLALVTENAGDVTFLRYAVGLELEQAQMTTQPVGERVARRLIDLGFAESAEKWLNRYNEIARTEMQRSMRAEIALSRERPRRALVELVGLKGREATALRAEALWESGEFQKVAQELTSVEDFDGAARGLWLAGNWAAVPNIADTRYAQVVERSTRLLEVETSADKLPPLAQARLLMKDSSEIRDGIKELLQDVSLE